MQKVVIIGAGGLGREIAWTIGRNAELAALYQVIAFMEVDPAKIGTEALGIPVVSPGSLEREGTGPVHFICGIGDNSLRERLATRALQLGWMPLTVVDPTAVLGTGAELGRGTFVAAGAFISIDVKIGEHVIINVHASIGHDSTVASFAQVCPGARVSGNCSLGERSFLGSNASVAPHGRIGRDAVLGGGSFCAREIPDATTGIGCPARLVPSKPAR